MRRRPCYLKTQAQELSFSSVQILALICFTQMTTVTIRAKLLVILIGWWTLLPQGASSFDLSLPRTRNGRRLTTSTRHHHGTHYKPSFYLSASSSSSSSSSSSNNVFWTPQDLTKDNPGFVPIPPSDYIKKYQATRTMACRFCDVSTYI